MALERGIAIGGWVPAGRLAEDGPIPARYAGVREAGSPDPAVRTALNVRDSDATLIVSHGPLTGGSRLTFTEATGRGRPVLHLDLGCVDPGAAAARLREWLRTVAPATLNVAGPRASHDPAIGAAVTALLRAVLPPAERTAARVAFDLADLPHLTDPYPTLAALRAVAPVVRLPSGFWAVTGYEAALEVLRQRACASGPIALRYLAELPPGAARDEMSHRINFLDPPDHTRVRGLVSKAFTPRRVADLVPWIRATAERIVDGLAGAHEFDLLGRFAHQVPSLVISELLGVPAADRDRLTAWSDEVAPLLAPDIDAADRERAMRASEAFHAYLGALLEERRRRPGDDLLSALLVAEEGGERLQRVELLSLAATLYSAGHRTTRDLFANGMSVLLADPERYRRVVDGRWAVLDVVGEFLRYETPTLFVARVPLEPVTIGGVAIGAYEPVVVFLAAANRDPAAYAEPDVFRPGRGDPEPSALSFAYGTHFCLGAAVARAEAEAMLSTAAQRWPDLVLAPGQPLRWRQRGPFRGLDALVVRRGEERPA